MPNGAIHRLRTTGAVSHPPAPAHAEVSNNDGLGANFLEDYDPDFSKYFDLKIS